MILDVSDIRGVIQQRSLDSYKGMYGCTVLIGGCIDYLGAAKLANISYAAMKSGTGLSRLCVPKTLALSTLIYLLESTLCSMPDDRGHMIFTEESVQKAMKGATSVAIGMGWGRSEENIKILSYILQNYEVPLVIDADGINALSGNDLDILNKSKCDILITPHIGEFASITGLDKEYIMNNRAETAKQFAAEHGITVLLKGSDTVITDGTTVFINKRGCPGMATAGSGDVLAGICAAICSFSRYPMLRKAACGAFVAGVAGELAQKATNPVSMTARDTVAYIPEAISLLI